jgi:alkylation response protein AidB-like acyl-CoA dehydrogenase
VKDTPGHHVMALIDCSDEAVTLAMDNKFVALDGTRTFAVQVRDLFVPDELVLADPIDVYLPKIRAGFVLLQAGMAFGIIQSSIDLMKQMARPLGHVNKYLEEQPEAFEEELAGMKELVWKLCETPHETDPGYWRDVLQARLVAGEATVKAAHAAMLHCGARGYVENGEAQRRLREAYFVAIVTPATKQLRKMLAEMAQH